MNERKCYRVVRTESQRTVITSEPFVALRLTAGGWKCIGTGLAHECEHTVRNSTGYQPVTWTDIPFGAQCTVNA